MALWKTIAVLPNVEMHDAIEGGRAAFVPISDPRVQAINEAYPRHRGFLESFTDAFGVKHHPTVLLVNPNASRRFMTVDAMASFRDVLSMSVIPRARARSIQGTFSSGILFSEAFDFYPWTLDKNHEYLIGKTPGMMGMHEVKKFKGQTASELTHMKMSPTDLDQPLFSELIKRWRRKYGAGKPDWTDIKLMRSLNMAHQASQLPAYLDTTFLDYGRLVALWVSAFEILVHPGPNSEDGANQWKVYNQLEDAHWIVKANRVRNFKFRNNNKLERRLLSSWLCRKLYSVRNDSLHGNPINKRRLRLPGGLNLENFAAPLYRMALTSFLDLRWKGALPPMQDAKALARACVEKWDFEHYQREIEGAIAMSRGHKRPPPESA